MNRKVDSKTELGNIINLARGDRSLRNYAKDSGVSYNTIHMIEKGELNPSPEIIKKLTSKQASPQNGVTYEAVMSAAGYKTENDEAMVSEEAIELAKHMLEEENEHSFLSPRVKQSREYRENEIRRIKTLARGMVFDALFEKGIEFGVNSREESSYRLRNNDMLLTIDHGDIKKWLLTFMCTTGGSYGGLFYHDTLGRYMTFEGGKDIKFSWVTNDPRAFARYKGYEHKLLFRGEMSLILVDTDAQKIVSETYLSNYFLDDYSREFYIV